MYFLIFFANVYNCSFVAELFIIFAKLEIILIFPETYPFSGIILSIDGVKLSLPEVLSHLMGISKRGHISV